jgi:hypothetical protein
LQNPAPTASDLLNLAASAAPTDTTRKVLENDDGFAITRVVPANALAMQRNALGAPARSESSPAASLQNLLGNVEVPPSELQNILDQILALKEKASSNGWYQFSPRAEKPL